MWGRLIPLLEDHCQWGDGVEGISSVTIPLGSGMVVREIFPRSMVPKAPSKVSMREDVLHPARAILIFPRPSHFSLAAFSSRWLASSIRVKP